MTRAASVLADALKQNLAAHRLPDDLVILHGGNAIVIASSDRTVRDVELGVAGIAPEGVLEHAARAAMPAVLRAMILALREAER